MEHYSAIFKKAKRKIVNIDITWTNLKSIMLIKKYQAKKIVRYSIYIKSI